MASIWVTDLTYFSSCRRSWLWGKRWAPKLPKVEYWLGSAVHEGLEAYYKSQRNPDRAIKAVESFAISGLRDLESEFPPDQYPGALEGFDELASLALGMIQNYAIFDEENPFPGKVLTVEQRFAVPIQVGSRSVTVSGRADLILETPTGIWVVDHKTSSSEFNLSGLDVDEQLTAYAWMYWKTTGVVPDSVVYNVLLKDLPAEPKELKSGGLSRDKSQKTVYQLYRDKLKELGLDEGDYQEILDHYQSLGWGKFFQRDGASRNVYELENFERRAEQKARDILNIQKDPEEYAYPSPSTYQCGWCQFLAPCKAMEDGGDYQGILEAKFKRS